MLARRLVPEPTAPSGAAADRHAFDMPRSNYCDLAVDLNGKSLLVTGGTGSFGKRLVRTVLDRYAPRRLIVLSRDELKQYEMQQDLGDGRYPCLRFFIGDVRDRRRLEMAMRDVGLKIQPGSGVGAAEEYWRSTAAPLEQRDLPPRAPDAPPAEAAPRPAAAAAAR